MNLPAMTVDRCVHKSLLTAVLCTLLLLVSYVWQPVVFAQTGLIEPAEEGIALPAVAVDNGTEEVDSSTEPAPVVDEPMLTVNFRDADILEVLEAYSNLLNINVVPGEGVSGTVTVISPGPITRPQAINLLHSILKHRGFAVIENDGYISVVQDAIAEMSGFP
ncbi:MAG: hypothetical protein V1246_05075, partial [Arenicellales bacterium]|nr:hypothetical protein [Arenicellales bacterium]